jgi:hypothetical protein
MARRARQLRVEVSKKSTAGVIGLPPLPGRFRNDPSNREGDLIAPCLTPSGGGRQGKCRVRSIRCAGQAFLFLAYFG